MNLKNIMLGERSQNKWLHIVSFYLYGISRKEKFIETEQNQWLVGAGASNQNAW